MCRCAFVGLTRLQEAAKYRKQSYKRKNYHGLAANAVDLLRMHGVTPFRLDIANFTRYILGGQVLCGTAVKFVMESQKPRPVSAKDAETRTGHPMELV